tara:strand:- start:125 stop:307 length:183 start_codon:yes stop_codon:yes gene_type:complete
LGIFDLVGPLSLTISSPFRPINEIGLDEIGVKAVLSLNTFIQVIALELMFSSSVRSYFRI